LIVVRFLQGLGGASLSAVSLAMVEFLHYIKPIKGKHLAFTTPLKGLG